MSNTTADLITAILGWFLLSYAIWRMFPKLRWKKRWMAWVPGTRYYGLGRAIGMDRDGAVCGALDFILILSQILIPEPADENATLALSLAFIVVGVLLIVYRIRLFLGIIRIFGISPWWVIGWVFVEWLPLMILAVSPRYQPVLDKIPDEEWIAGTDPAAIASGRSVSATDSGLSVHIRERSVRDLNKKRYLLKDISLNIPNGSMVLLLGGSGSGKTTFINAVNGYEKADADILLNGRNVYREYDQVRHRIGYVPQQNLIRNCDTVLHTIDDAAQMRLPGSTTSESRQGKVQEVMDLLGLTAGCKGLVGKKSGGQLRRISIAMELVTDPELFILDEPDSGLDGVIARELFMKLREIADEGKIVIVITHTPDRVADLFDRVIVLARDSGRVGRLSFYGTPEEAYEFFGKDTMEGIVMSINRKEEGGEGRADEFIRRFASESAPEENTEKNAAGKSGETR